MKYLLCIGLFLSSLTFVYAQSDASQFNIKVAVGTDTVAPSTPTLLSVTPISPNQIDLSWTPATDNFSLQGYVVIRGTSTIATTTATSFSDTSVSASTTYSYRVRAFDAALNYSSSSNSLATTTPDFPAPGPDPEIEDGGVQEGTVARIVLRNLLIKTGKSTTSLAVETARPVRLTVRWGRTKDYELGYLVNEYFSRQHAIVLTDLEPGTTYEFEIIAETPFGLESVVRTGEFTTNSADTNQSPANVGRFAAVPVGSDVRLSWQLPPVPDLSFVRVVRSHLGFPTNPQDGAVVYQGKGTGVIDSNILTQYSPVYYTAFVLTAEGKVSSGAIALVYAQSEGSPVGVGTGSVTSDVAQTPDKVTEATTTIDTTRLTPDMRIPELSEVLIVQAGREYSFIGPQVVLSATTPFTLRIPALAVAGHLKSIVGTVLDPTDNRQSYSFLLRLNEDRTHYEADIAALGVEGDSVLTVAIYDYEALTVATYTTPVQFGTLVEDPRPVLFPDILFQSPVSLLLGLVLLAVVTLVSLLIWRMRQEDEDND